MICLVPECSTTVHARGLCRPHYRRLHYEERERDRRGNTATPEVVGAAAINYEGYARVKFDYGRSYELMHRIVMAVSLGRLLEPHENVHHINGDKADNRLENLELWSTSQPKGQRVVDKIAWAKSLLELYGEDYDSTVVQGKDSCGQRDTLGVSIDYAGSDFPENNLGGDEHTQSVLAKYRQLKGNSSRKDDGFRRGESVRSYALPSKQARHAGG